MLIILNKLSILYIFLLVGFVFGKWKSEQNNHTGILSFLLVNLFLPAKVFNTFANNFTKSYILEHGKTIAVSLSLLLLLVGFSLLVAKLLTRDKYEQKVYRYSLTLSNYAYMGYALCESIFGEMGLTNLILFCIPFAIYTYTFGYAMLTEQGRSIKKLVNPLNMAIVLGIIAGLCGIKMPDILSSVISSSSACVAPISMLLTGITLSAFSMRELFGNIRAYILTAVRLVVIPATVFIFCKALSLGAVTMPAVMMSCMPCGLNTIVFPKLIGKDCRLGARLAMISHLFSIATIPLWLSLIQ